MPFKSKAQQAYMFVHHPKIAHRWAEETPNLKQLPTRIKKPKKKVRKLTVMGQD